MVCQALWVVEVWVEDSVDRSNRFPFVYLIHVVVDEVELAKYNLRKTNKQTNVIRSSSEFMRKTAYS